MITAAHAAIDRERMAWTCLSLDKDFQEALDRIEAALNHTCKWSPLDEDCPGAYETSCGEAWQFWDGEIKDNQHQKICSFCGGWIEEVQRLPDAEEDK